MFPPHVRPVELKIQSTVAKSTNAEFQVSCQAPQAGERKSALYVCVRDATETLSVTAN